MVLLAPAWAACATAPKPVEAVAEGRPVDVSTPSQPSPPSIQPAPQPSAPVPVPAPATSVARQKEPAAETLAGYLAALRAASCPPGAKAREPDALDLELTPVGLSRLPTGQTRVGELDYVAGFQLTAASTRFGGLSGLDFLEDGRLLAVSDQGDFVWITLDKAGLTPLSAEIAGMLGPDGATLGGKEEGDAEGLAVQGGLALVSFERLHRAMAFDLSGCGAAARGAPLTLGGRSGDLVDAFARRNLSVGDNAGVEPLAVTADWVLFAGLETQADEAGPLSARAIEAAPGFTLLLGSGAPDFVGLDLLPDPRVEGGVRAYSLHRGFSNVAGLSISVMETVLAPADAKALKRADIAGRAGIAYRVTGARRLADIGMLQNIDNFEGIAARSMPDGSTRLFLVSDNNFSDRQRTLLMVFDIRP